jgi:ABC-type sugar transport system ATPase subunit
MEKGTPVVEMIGISKKFGEIKALENVNITLRQGEILGLVGDNGAGKSTLMKILAGVYPPTKGRIFFEGKEVRFAHPGEARSLGIEMIYQDLALAENMDVVENVFLGNELERPALTKLVKVIDRRRMEEETWGTLQKLRIEIASLSSKVETLSGGQRQSVAIARAIRSNAKVIIMDEPTAALGISEVERLLKLVKELKKRNMAVVIVSHRLEDIFRVGDRVVVLRHGKCVGNKKLEETSMDEVRKLIVGEIEELV